MLKQILNKIFSHSITIESPDCARCVYRFCGIKISYRVKNPIFNAKLCNKIGIKTLLVVRSDGIGDFLFTRPYLKCIKNSAKYRNYKLFFAGTPQMIELVNKYDSDYVDYCIPLIGGNEREEADCIQKFKKMSFNIIINPIDSKYNGFIEKIVSNIQADEKIVHFGFFSNREIKEKKDVVESVLKSYTRIIDTGSEIKYVWDREKDFFERLLEEKLPIPKQLGEMSDIDLKSDFVVISPFARAKNRIYSTENFAVIINYITEKLKLPVVIIGSKNEGLEAQNLASRCINRNMIFNMAGKLTLSESIMYIRLAKLLVANETGTVHIAQNYKVNTVCISNGSFMNTFQPYPEDVSYVRYVYPDNINKYLQETKDIGCMMYNDINEIPPEKVIKYICRILKETVSV